ncbi:uncharacterized protein L203_102251 [Cryptococcus depauperatus CBS 7841]|uniref:Uncharacterized protein n=1 Tax=Cryptococcus depauperatus CBS 7841 TaxID=1295531 RepID=A0A1E3IRV0_9TREE|nr:hypothetical protein L203_01507 [Cryptococcus depauperatus CBS 7841]
MAKLVLASLLLSLVLGAPSGRSVVEKRSAPLSCVQFQYGGPFTASGSDGWIHLYANITHSDADSQKTTFKETRLGLAPDGTIQPCGECKTTELFGFDVCQNDERKGFNGLVNSPASFYGHIVYRNVDSGVKCLTARPGTTEGAPLQLEDCQYDYDSAGSSKQYFQMSVTDGGFRANLLDQNHVYGPDPQLETTNSLVLYNIEGAKKTFTGFGFKAPEF